MKVTKLRAWLLLPLFIGCANGAPPSSSSANASRQRAAAQGAPWPGWTRMEDAATESLLTSCAGRHPGYWALQKDETGRVSPRAAMPRRAPRWDALPVTPLPPEIAQPAVSGAERRVVEGAKAWLVALDVGEFGEGLYSVDKESRQAVRLDPQLPEAVRWIERLDFGVVAVAGLCHGEGCARATRVYRVDPSPTGWTLAPLAELGGCPVAIAASSGDREALLLTCKAAHSIRSSGLATAASWQGDFTPIHFSDAAQRDASGALYVSFGPLVARFQPGAAPEWFGPRGPRACGPNSAHHHELP
jgi:hypothetical protein